MTGRLEGKKIKDTLIKNMGLQLDRVGLNLNSATYLH